MALTITLHENLTSKQRAILRSRSNHLVLKGPAGTSKTYIALARGLRLLSKGEVDKIIIIRSAVEIRKIGFLPGDSSEKLDVYTAPYVHLVAQLSPKKNFKSLVHSKEIEFHSTSYLRGQTFDDSYILVDEYQNLSEHELESVVTRVGEGSHLILCGDNDQSDLPKWEQGGYKTVLKTVEQMPDFSVYEFSVDDIVRSDFVKRYYQIKKGATEVTPFEGHTPKFIQTPPDPSNLLEEIFES